MRKALGAVLKVCPFSFIVQLVSGIRNEIIPDPQHWGALDSLTLKTNITHFEHMVWLTLLQPSIGQSVLM
jgi:hypothetical protein